MSLTTAECQQFHDLGYVVKEDIYSQADLQPLKDGLTAVIDQTCADLARRRAARRGNLCRRTL